MSLEPYLLAFDVGGTKIAAAAFDLAGNRLTEVRATPTLAGQAAERTLDNLRSLGETTIAAAGRDESPAAVGIGCPGPLDVAGGRILEVDNLPNLRGFGLVEWATRAFGAPAFIENDAGCFALGEARRGVGRGARSLAGLTLGTFFGCGIVLDGRIYSGATNNAGETAYCPVAGSTFDAALSGAGVRRFYAEAGGAQAADAETIGDLAAAGDGVALEAWRRYGEALGTALGVIVAVLDPEVCALGGSIASRFELFRAPMLEAARRVVAPPAFKKLRVERAALGAGAAVAGAAELAFDRLRERRRA